MKIKSKSRKHALDSEGTDTPNVSESLTIKMKKKKKTKSLKKQENFEPEETFTAELIEISDEICEEPKPKKRKKKKKKKEQDPEPFEIEDEIEEIVLMNSDEEMEFVDESIELENAEPFEFSNDLFEVPEFPVKSKSVALPYMKTFLDGIWYRKLSSNALLVSILPETDLYFVGKAAITVVKGIVNILGHDLSEKDLKRTVYSPKGHSSLLCISGISAAFLEDSATSRDSFSEPDFLDDDERAFERIISLEELQEMPGATIVMEGFENSWCEGVRRYGTDGLALVGPKISGIGSGKTPKLTKLLGEVGFQFVAPEQEDNRRVFKASEDWQPVFDSLCEESSTLPQRVIIFGGKGVGKSTFSRWLINKALMELHSGLLYIDLDPGQSEFTPPGLVSVIRCTEPLLGPNFTHLQQPLMSVFVGSSSVSDQPLTYLNAIKQVWTFVQKNPELRKIPWIINTMGFTQGLGVDFACETIKLFQPMGVIQIGIENDRRCFPFPLALEDVLAYDGTLSKINRGEEAQSNSLPELPQYLFIEMESVCNSKDDRNENQWGVNARELRDNLLVSYFANLIGSNDILSVTPQSLSLDNVAIGTMNSRLDYADTLKAMNGNLVALCTCPLDYITSDPGVKMILNKTGLGVPNICYGYGMVRAIDTEKSLLFILTPVSADDLQKNVNSVLCAGSVGMPLQFYVNSFDRMEDYGRQEIPYVMTTSKVNSKLHTATKRQFVPKRVAHSVLKNCLM